MISIEVKACFDFLPEEETVGTLRYESVRGTAVYEFEYAGQFLQKHKNLLISADLNRYLGRQVVLGDIFSCFGDCLPDRWGKALIDKRERILARQNNRPVRSFSDFDYMVRLDDRTRMGAFRFYHNDELIEVASDGRDIPIIANIGKLTQESRLYEQSVIDGKEPRDEWVDNLWRQGSSLGGARPKATVADNDGNLWIAKLPSVRDTYDIAIWECFASGLARKAHICVPDTQVLSVPSLDYHVLLSRRFDRSGNKRIHYASSLTLTGFKDGDGWENGKGYPDIADIIVGEAMVFEPEKNLEELFRRVVFNICIGNHDDHFRNHGFILTEKGWTLSPAFDMNPTNEDGQSLLVTSDTNMASIWDIYNASDDYLIEKNRAAYIIWQTLEAIKNWRIVARRCGINSSEQQRFAVRLNNSLQELPRFRQLNGK